MLKMAVGLSVGLFVLPAFAQRQAGNVEPVGRPEVGKALMRSNDQRCDRCHGVDGEGGYGPDLAGTGLSFTQFKRAVRQPFGIMPSFTEGQINVAVPAEASVVSATGTGYKGVRRDPKSGADFAVWSVPRIAAAEKQTYTLTLSGTAAATGIAKGSTVSWSKPAVREGFQNTVTQDDSVNLTVTRSAGSQ